MTDVHFLAGRAILLAEDDYFIMEALRNALQERGAEVVGPAPSVTHALHLVDDALRLDAAVLDLNLQGEMAFSLADALAERGVPFLFVTGYDRATIPERHRAAIQFEKPTQPDDVVQVLGRILQA